MKKIIFWGVACFQIVMVSILIHFLPSEVPIHFNLIGEIDRWGSKYELYSIVGVTLICLIPLYLMVHRIEKRTLSFNITQKEKKEIKKQVDIILYCGIGLGILMTFFIIYSSVKAVTIEKHIIREDSVLQSSGIFLGITLLIFGIFLVFVKKNNVVGIRTHWSMKNDITWKYSQRYGAIILSITGLISIFLSCLYKGKFLLLLILIMILIACIICFWITKKVYDKYGEKE